MRKLFFVTASLVLASACSLGLAAAENQPSEKVPDNSARNKVVNLGPTAQEQSNAKEDLQLVANVRRAIVGDKTLSTYGHNIKIITTTGAVFLKGPVKSDIERKKIVALVGKVAGVEKIQDELEIIR